MTEPGARPGDATGSANAHGYRERWLISRDNLRLYYREYGVVDGGRTAVLCLGGLTRNCKDFHELAIHLGAERRVLCPDYRGRGRSQYDPDWRHYEPTTYLDDIHHLLTATNTHRVFVIGTSMGGLLAMGLAVMTPMAVAGALLNDIGPDLGAAGLSRILDYIGTDRPQASWADAVAHLKEIMPAIGLKTEDAWLSLAHNTYREGDDGLLHFDWDVNLARPLRRAAPTPDLWPLFRALRGRPVAALRGAQSDVLSTETFARMGREIPDLVRTEIPDVGHTPTLDEPEARATLQRVLEQVEPA